MQFSISSVNRRRWFSEEQAKREERAKCMQMCLGLCMLVHVRDFLDYFKITWKFFIWIFFNFSGQLCPVLSFFLSFYSCFYSPLLLLWLMFTHTWLRSYRCSSPPLFCIIRLFYNRNGASGISNKKRKYKFSYFFLVFCFFLELPFEVLSHFVLTQLLLCSGRAGKLTGWFRNCFSSVLRFIARGLSGLCCLMWRSRF